MQKSDSNTISLSSRPIQNPAVLSRLLEGGEMILVNGDNGSSLALTNPTAVLIWELMDGRNTVGDIVQRIKEQFEKVPPTVEAEVLALLDKLAQGGFIGFEWKGNKV